MECFILIVTMIGIIIFCVKKTENFYDSLILSLPIIYFFVLIPLALYLIVIGTDKMYKERTNECNQKYGEEYVYLDEKYNNSNFACVNKDNEIKRIIK